MIKVVKSIFIVLVALCAVLLGGQVRAGHEHQHGAQQVPPSLPAATTISETIVSPANSSLTNTSKILETPPAGSDHAKHTMLHNGIKTIIDLSHPLDNATLHWPTVEGFSYLTYTDSMREGPNKESYYVKSDGFKMAVHCGTHLDAPRHFSKDAWTVDKIPLERLIDVPLNVIDLSDKVKANRSYSFQKEDFVSSTTGKPLQLSKSVVLIYTGISQLYDQGAKAYFGTETKNISEMQIPGFSKEAAQYLVDSGVFGVGLDAPSADSSVRHGSNETYDPVAHVILNSNNIYILENINNKLANLVKNDATMRLTIAPLSIVGGSGSPVRLIAVSSHDECAELPRNSAPVFTDYKINYIIMALISSIIILA